MCLGEVFYLLFNLKALRVPDGPIENMTDRSGTET